MKEIKKKNDVYLKEFIEDLTKEGLKENTIRRHYQNVKFYLNVYLLQWEALEMAEGTDWMNISGYLGEFFIRKCVWSTPASIKSTATSIKKFYKCMLKRGHITEDDYLELDETIKEKLDDWMLDCKIYNDPNEPNPFAFF